MRLAAQSAILLLKHFAQILHLFGQFNAALLQALQLLMFRLECGKQLLEYARILTRRHWATVDRDPRKIFTIIGCRMNENALIIAHDIDVDILEIAARSRTVVHQIVQLLLVGCLLNLLPVVEHLADWLINFARLTARLRWDFWFLS